MDFSVTLNRVNSLEYLFEDDEFKPFDTSEGEPSSIRGSILVDDKEIGQILLYEIYNDNDFYIVATECPEIVQLLRVLYAENRARF